jgi:predicted component of type VI protein secretion system
MSRRIARVLDIETPESAPLYEARIRRYGPADFGIEVWQLPSVASPHVKTPVRIAGLRGRNLDIVEHRILRRLSQAGVKLTGLESERKEAHRITEDLALTLGLLFRTLAPMRSRDKMRALVEGIEAMGREESAYWLGMAMHRKNPRRVLTALRFLLTDPEHTQS